MKFIGLYIRVLALLGHEGRFAAILSVANLVIAAAQFAEPVLFGKVIDTLTGAQANPTVEAWHTFCCWRRGSDLACSTSPPAR